MLNFGRVIRHPGAKRTVVRFASVRHVKLGERTPLEDGNIFAYLDVPLKVRI